MDLAIRRSLEFALRNALTFKSRVGALLITRNNRAFIGFNIENSCHKGYHAEETALINALLHGYRGKELKQLYLIYDFHGHSENVYPMCGHCRQLYWEFTHPDLIVTVVNLKGEVIFEGKLCDLYPFPYPRIDEDVTRTTQELQ